MDILWICLLHEWVSIFASSLATGLRYTPLLYNRSRVDRKPLARGDAIFKETGYQLLSIAELLISTCKSMNINFAHQLGNKIDENKYSSNIDDTSLLVFFFFGI